MHITVDQRQSFWVTKEKLKLENKKLIWTINACCSNILDHGTCDYEVDLSSRIRAYSPDLKRYITFSQKFPGNFFDSKFW